MKLKIFCKAKDSVNQSKEQPTKGKKIFTNSVSETGLISKIYEELEKLDIKNYNPITKWDTDINGILFPGSGKEWMGKGRGLMELMGRGESGKGKSFEM